MRLTGGIVAAASAVGTHIATDSMAYKSRVCKLLAGKNLTSKTPWALQADGDLWQVMEDTIKARGAHSLNVSWTKGHATQAHIQQGRA